MRVVCTADNAVELQVATYVTFDSHAPKYGHEHYGMTEIPMYGMGGMFQASGRPEAPGTNGTCLPSGSRPETALRSDPGATTTVTRGGIRSDATSWPARGMPLASSADIVAEYGNRIPDAMGKAARGGRPEVCSQLIDLAGSGNACRMAVETRIARYPGHCAYCDEPIRVGDPIRLVTNTMDWIHASHDLDA